MTGAEIAIIGMAGRFPDAANVREFWGNLVAGKESIKFLSPAEISQLTDTALTTNPSYVPAKGGHIENLDWFDAAFFNYTPKEAEIMDPQFRLFHECVWSALEDAGYAKENYPGLIGLYAGASGNFQWQKKLKDSKKYANRKGLTSIQFVERDFLPTLVSYNLNLKGPSYNVQTACSTSLVAIHLACQAILNGECELALAGGVSVSYGLDKGYLYQEGSIFSPDGHCRAFDAKAKGCIHGSGAGVVVLKLLEDAIAHNDHIYAVIRGSAINNDGKRKVGFTAPSILGQADVIRSAHQVAEVDPSAISYVEAHGTGTEIGDPIEMEALKMVFGNSGRHHCGIGSVKTNVGHLDAAAGVTGVIKTALALRHRAIPPSLHFESPNPKIDFKNSAFYVVDKLKEWESDSARLAGVSSFGIGGTNAHVVLEEAPQPEPALTERSMHLLNFSARTKKSLDNWTASFAQFLESTDASIADIAHTLQNGRKTFDARGFIACANIDEAIGKLKSGEVFFNEQDASAKPVVFMFPGQGAQYVNMGLGLFNTEPLFRDELKSCFGIYKSLTGQDLEALLYPANGEDTSEAITQTSVTQPLLFIFEYALARFLMELGIQPQLMIGHSIGEYVAACLAGVIELKDAIRLVVKRGQLIQQLPKGSMLSVQVDEAAIQPYLNQQVSLAVINSSAACVVAGSTGAIEALQQQLKQAGISSTMLKTSHAFHSAMMEPALEAFEKTFDGIQLNAPSIPFISNVTGDFITNEEAVSPAYWVKQLRSTVKFAAGLERLMQQEAAVFVEVGPGNSLSNFVTRHTARKDTHKLVSTVRNARVAGKDEQHFHEAIGRLWLLGASIDFPVLYANEARRKVSLPTYCYDRIQLDTPADVPAAQPATSPEQKRPVAEWFYSPVWELSPPAESIVNTEFFNNGQWLVFTNAQGLPAALTRYLPVDNVKTIQFGQSLSEQDCAALLQSLQLDENAPLNIIHTWCLTENANEPLTLDRCEQRLEQHFYSLLNFIRALGFRKQATRLAVLTNNSFEVTGGELLYPENTAHAALVKILPLEYKNLDCQLIDLSTEHLTGNNELETAQQIFSILSTNPPNKITALRGASQWVPAVKQVDPGRFARNENLLADGNVYLVLGLGGMGVYMAKHIADSFNATVIIVHRSPFPSPDEWPAILENGNGQVAAKVRLLHEASLHAKGRIQLVQGDIASLESMSAVVAQIENEHGRISGIIHTAGVIDKGGVAHRRSNKSIAESIASKVKGAVIIDTLFKGKELDFFMLFSSLGNEFYEEKYGELGYNIANEFLDAYVQCRSNIKRKIGINWCDWQEVGMAMKAIDALFNGDGSRQKELEQFNAAAILPREGVEAFAKLCNSTLTRVLLYPFDLQARLKQRDKTLLNYAEYLEKKFSLLADAAADNNFVPLVKFNSLDENIINIWKEYLGHKEISVHDNIFELGASSLDVVTVKNIFKTSLGIDVPVTALFEYPTIHAFLKFIKGTETEDNAAAASERIDKGRDKLGKLKKLSTKG
jgi:acyl transferase domain-containing protein/acyl carrier protein